jgi:hypothetical protein
MTCMCGVRHSPMAGVQRRDRSSRAGTFLAARFARSRSSARSFSAAPRLLVQWVPHGFGYRSLNVGFCLWLRKRARRGDRVEIMVHEPYLAFGGGALGWTAAASVHRLMTVILARAASRIWIAIPDWERRWRPYLLGRNVPFTWLPVPGSLPNRRLTMCVGARRYARMAVRSSATWVMGHREAHVVCDPARFFGSPSRRILLGQRGTCLSATDGPSGSPGCTQPARSPGSRTSVRRATCWCSRIRTASAVAGPAMAGLALACHGHDDRPSHRTAVGRDGCVSLVASRAARTGRCRGAIALNPRGSVWRRRP